MPISNILVNVLRAGLALMSPFASRLESEFQRVQGLGFYSSTKQEVNALLKILGPTIDPRFLVLDIGANIGDYTAEILRQNHRAQVASFEPSSVAFSHLSKRFLNEPRVSIQNVALSDTSEKRKLYFDFLGSGMASLVKRDLRHLNIDFSKEESVTVMTLNDWIVENEKMPKALKIDVEGHELEVLIGGKKVLRNLKVVQFEFGGTNIDSRHFFKDYWDFFQELRFDLYRLTPTGIKKVISYSESLECFKFSNYYAVNKSD